MYSLGWEDMGAVVKLEEWTLVVVGLADNAGMGLDVGLALAGCVKAVLPNERQIERESNGNGSAFNF